MRHFLPKRTSSSSASSRPKSAPTQQTAKPAPTTLEPRPPEEIRERGRSRSERHYNFSKRQGPQPKIALDPVPKKSSWSARQKEEGPESRYRRNTPQTASHVSLATSRNAGAEKNVFSVPHWPATASRCPNAVIADKIKHKHFQKESKLPFLPPISVLPLCSQSAQPFQPLATRADAWQAISVCVSVGNKHVKMRLFTQIREIVPPAQSESGFYSRYFLVLKKDGGLRPILDLRLLNHALMKRSFRMITLKQILSQICLGDWFISLDLKDAYFHLQIAPHHTLFLIFAFEGVAYQYKVLPFGLSLAPALLHDAWMRLSPLWDRWESAYSTTSTTGSFWPRETEGSSSSLASRMPPRNGDSGLCISPDPLEEPPLAKARHESRHGAQKEGCHDRRFQQGLGSAVRGQTDLRSVVWGGINPAHQLPEMLAACQACQFFLPVIRGHHVLVRSDSRSMVSYINHQGGLVSNRLCTLVNDLLVWAENNLHSLKATHVPGKINQGADMLSRNNVSSEEWMLHRLTVQKIWEIFGKTRVDLFASKDNSHCPIFFYKEHRCPGPRMTKPSALCFSPNRSATAGTQTSKGTTSQASFNSTPLEEPTVGVRIIPAADGSPVANPLETGPPFSSERHNMVSTARVIGPACVAARREPFSLPEYVLNTMAEARAPSTRRLYALKWSIFSAWCQDRDLELVTSEVSVVLSFQQ